MSADDGRAAALKALAAALEQSVRLNTRGFAAFRVVAAHLEDAAGYILSPDARTPDQVSEGLWRLAQLLRCDDGMPVPFAALEETIAALPSPAGEAAA